MELKCSDLAGTADPYLVIPRRLLLPRNYSMPHHFKSKMLWTDVRTVRGMIKHMQRAVAAQNGLFGALLARSDCVGIRKVFECP